MFGLRHVAISGLQQTLQHGLHIITHITRLGERGGVRDDERHVHHLGKSLGKIGLAHTGGPQQQNVRFGHLHIAQRIGRGVFATRGSDLTRSLAQFHIDAFVVIVYGHGKRPLGRLLPDDVPIEIIIDLHGLGQSERVDFNVFDALVGNDAHA